MKQNTFRITSYDVYRNGNAKLSSLLKYMQQLARDDSDQKGYTYEEMRKSNMVFVITKLAMHFEKNLKEGDTVKITTFLREVVGVTFKRCFVCEINGETAFYAMTDWVLIDYEKRNILRPSSTEYGETESPIDFPVFDVKKRIQPADDRGVVTHKVRYTELDQNGHLNNTVYADIVVDNLKVIPDSSVESFYLNFNGEAMFGDELEIRSSFDGKTHLSSGNIGTKQCYTAELTYFGE